MLNLQQNEYPDDGEQREQSVRLRIPLAGLVIALSLLSGAAAGIFAYRYAANHSRPTSATPAPAASAAPPAETPAAGDTQETGPPPPIVEKPATSEKPIAVSQPAVRRIDLQLVNGNRQLTITLDRMVKYDAHRLEHPDRIYIDLHGVHLTPQAIHNAVVKQDGIADIRLGKIPPNTVRVVLDLDQRFDYAVTQQMNPAAVILKLMPHAAAHHKRHPTGHPQGTAGRDGVNRNS